MEIANYRGCDYTGAGPICVSAELWVGTFAGRDVISVGDQRVLSRAPLGLDGREHLCRARRLLGKQTTRY